MQKEPPDVVITDLEMPRMDGLTFIRKIMAEMPTPVVVCSGLAARGTELALRALEEGAVEVITKPKVGVRDFLHESAVTLLDAVWSASQAQLKPRPIASFRGTDCGRRCPASQRQVPLCGRAERINCRGRFNWWHRGAARLSHRPAHRLPAGRHRAAYARSVHAGLCGTLEPANVR